MSKKIKKEQKSNKRESEKDPKKENIFSVIETLRNPYAQ